MSENSSTSDPLLPGLKLTATIWGLFFARWFIPAEAVGDGQSLWLSIIVWLTAVVWAHWQSRCETPVTCRDHWGLVVGAVIASHLVAIVGAGTMQGQTSFNLFAEWPTIGISFVLLRNTLLTAARRRAFLQAALALSMAIAGYGIWQHYALFPQRAAEYLNQRAEYDQLVSARPSTADEARRNEARLIEIREQWLAQEIPIDGSSRGLFERRLRDSSEPTGFFALANTFGGLLATSFVLLVTTVASQLRVTGQKRWLTLMVPIVGSVLVAVCLLLTKSRTAWVGTLFGFGLWSLVEILRAKHWLPNSAQALAQSSDPQTAIDRKAPAEDAVEGGAVASNPVHGRPQFKLLARGIAVFLALALLITVVTKLGGLDAEVVSEAPKSLRYRLEYWSATSRIIAEHPLIGVGPGNFRTHYLRHKLETASEEIADPHSFLFEVLSNTGAIGGITLATFLAAVAAAGWRALRCGLGPLPYCDPVAEQAANGIDNRSNGRVGNVSQKDSSQSLKNDAAGMAMAAILGAIGVIVGHEFLFEANLNFEVLIVGGAAAIVVGLMQYGSFASDSAIRLGATLGIAVLLVHLLGAGGFSYPAIHNWLLALVAIVSLTGHEFDRKLLVTFVTPARVILPTTPRKMQFVAAVSLATGLMIAHWLWLPTLTAEGFLLQGKLASQKPGQLPLAREAYFKAHQAAPLQPLPLMSLAQIEFSLSEQHESEAHFKSAIEFARQAEARTGNSGNVPLEVGRWYQQRFSRTRDQADARSAVEWIERAINRYPTNPFWNGWFAIALRDAQQLERAQEVARRTLRFEEINQRAGHLDRLLPEDTLRELKALVAE